MDAKKYRQGVEYGSARWGTKKDIQPFISPDFQQNVILTQTESLTMESRPKNPKYARNKNCLIDPTRSMHYNPFAYIHNEKDILKLVNALIANTKGDGKAGDEFWTKAETLLYTALIGYIHYEAPELSSDGGCGQQEYV